MQFVNPITINRLESIGIDFVIVKERKKMGRVREAIDVVAENSKDVKTGPAANKK